MTRCGASMGNDFSETSGGRLPHGQRDHTWHRVQRETWHRRRGNVVNAIPGLRVAPLCGLVTALLMAPDAAALSCAAPEFSAPGPGATAVPTNTLVWCGGQSWASDAVPLWLKDASGAEVAGTSHVLETTDYDVTVFVPDEPLSPNTTYSYGCMSEGREVAFTTGAGPSEEDPPALPDPSTHRARTTMISHWGDSVGVIFENVAPAGTLVVVDVNAGANLRAEDPSGAVAEILLLDDAGSVFVRNGPCGGAWPDAALGDTASIAFGAFDLTGRFSGWSEAVEVTLPETYTDPPEEGSPTVPPANDEQDPQRETSESAGGCQFALGSSAHAWWILSGVAALAARRSRRTSRSTEPSRTSSTR